MKYTVPMVVEKAMELLTIAPLFVHYGTDCVINGFSTFTRERRRQDILWLNDNSGGTHPYSACAARHCVYIASRAEETGSLPDCEADRTLVILPNRVQMRRLVTAMEQCFAFYNAWTDDLLDVVRNGGDWYEMLEAGHRVLRNPMLIFNRSMRVMAYTTDDGTEDTLWKDTVRTGMTRVVSPSQSADMMRFLEMVEQHRAPFRFEGEGMSHPFWSAPVRVGERVRGMVNIVGYHHPLTAGETDLLQVFSEYVAIAMQRPDPGVPTPDAVPRQFMLDLLNGSIASRDLLETRLIAVDWPVQRYFRFIVLRAGLPVLTGEQWRSSYDRLKALGLNGISCMIGQSQSQIGLLITAADSERFDLDVGMIASFCKMNHLRAGISDIYKDIMETPRYRTQAELALELAWGTACSYAQVRYACMLRHLRSHPYPEDLMHPAVARLEKLDESEGTEYIATLRALLRHSLNQLETAQSLGIHRTTLAYRLRRIHELTGLRFSDDDEMFHLAVSLKLLQRAGDSQNELGKRVKNS